MRPLRPIRFGAGVPAKHDPEELRAAGRRAEVMGFSALTVADHFMIPMAPLLALQAVAAETTTLRLGQVVLAQGFRHPAILAKELATLDVLSGGRVEVGLGAGWMRQEYDQAGLPFPRAGVRIEQVEETAAVLRGLFGDGPCTFRGKHFAVTELDGMPKPLQRPGPPILVGGGGRKLLAAAGRCADIVQLLPGPIGQGVDARAISTEGYRERIAVVREAAGARFDAIELGALLLDVTVTNDRDAAEAASAARLGVTPRDLRASPVVAIGSLDWVCEKLLRTRDELGVSYFMSPPGGRPETLAPVVERLTGR